MFKIAFQDGRDGQLVWGARPEYNREVLGDTYMRLHFRARIGESLMDFASLTGDISASGHPFIQLAGELGEDITENSVFFVVLRTYLNLIVEDKRFFTMDCLMFFLELTGSSIPAFYHKMRMKEGMEDYCIEDDVPYDAHMDSYERSFRGFLVSGKDVYDVPFTVYECETVDDACCASLHFLITHNFTIRKCKNCGKYFIAYNRSDAIYCDRTSPYNSNTICSIDGPARTFRESVKEDRLKQLISNTQAMWRMRKKRYPDDPDIQQAVINFAKNLKKWRVDYKGGKVTEEEFIAWLEHFKSR